MSPTHLIFFFFHAGASGTATGVTPTASRSGYLARRSRRPGRCGWLVMWFGL